MLMCLQIKIIQKHFYYKIPLKGVKAVSFHLFLSEISLLILLPRYDNFFFPQHPCPHQGKNTYSVQAVAQKRVTRLSVYANIFCSVSRIFFFKRELEPVSQAHDCDALCSPTRKETMRADQLH